MFKIYTIKCGNRVKAIYALNKADAISAYREDNRNMGNPVVLFFEKVNYIDISLKMSNDFYNRYEPLIENHEDKIHI